MVSATPAAVERAFASRGILVARVAQPPELCTPRSCVGLEYWGGKIAYLAPRTARPDFVVVLLPTFADARRVGAVGRDSGLATVRRGSTLLVYLRSSPRVLRLRRALASLR